MHPDEGFAAVDGIYREFAQFCASRGQVSESDTRAKAIDRILKEALGWPESVIGREDPVHRGFTDYTLSSQTKRPILIVEAKREGLPFDLPVDRSLTHYKLNGFIRTNKSVYDAIEQVQWYCNETGVRYAVATNGYAWLVFKAIRDDMPWRRGQAVAFCSAGAIKERFSEFWNLLSYSAVLANSLDISFSGAQTIERKLPRVLDRLLNPDQALVRNRLHTKIHPIVDSVFGDIAAQEKPEIMEKCYIHSQPLRFTVDTLQWVITDAVPRFAEVEGAVQVTPGPRDAGQFGVAVRKAIKEPTGSVVLLLGGIGSGKSTFIKRFLNHVGKEFLDSTACWFYISFLHPPEAFNLEEYIYSTILEQIRLRYADMNLESRESVLMAYQDQIERLDKMILKAEELEPKDYQRRLNSYIEQWVKNESGYVDALLSLIRRRGKAIVIAVDNVDQLAPGFQESIFLLSQRVAHSLHAVVLLALREESFYSSTIQKTFAAYNDVHKFHISSPSFRALIGKRLTYARRLLSRSENDIELVLDRGVQIDKEAISDFLAIMHDSLFGHNRNIVRFIESISYGNMREALSMFSKFLYSGSTDVDKMLRIFSDEGPYYVAFHEFAKSVILGDRRYYRESPETVLNVFDCGPERNSSHLTGLRLLELLLGYRGTASPEGRGFADINMVLQEYVSVFDNEQDFIRTADRLLRHHLIEVDTRVSVSITQASSIRITPSGWYYLTYLSKAFSYLDLVLHDTPINDSSTYEVLVDYAKRVDTFREDSQNSRDEKLELRFARSRAFLDYLDKEEACERERFSLQSVPGCLGELKVPPIRTQLEKEILSIKGRLRRNRGAAAVDEPEAPEPPPDLRPQEGTEEEPPEAPV